MKKNLLLLVMLSFACCSKRESHLPRLIVPKADTVVHVNTKKMLESSAPIIALNFIKDTTILRYKGNEHIFGTTVKLRQVIPHEDVPKYDIKVIIDTAYAFAPNGFIYKNVRFEKTNPAGKIGFDGVDFESVFGMMSVHVDAWPVLLYNNSNSEAILGSDTTLDAYEMIQEALDTDGQWKPIEFSFGMFPCCTCSDEFIIAPKHYSATAIIKYHGDFKTKIRVKLRSHQNVYYSNVISGTINRSQFNQDFIRSFLMDRRKDDPAFFEDYKKIMFLK